MAGHGLSKSRIVAWKQCPKRLWLQILRRDLLEVSDEVERGFQIGYEVGEVAQSLFPRGPPDRGQMMTCPQPLPRPRRP